ncbi:MAG: hypothetical protein AAF637_14615 [Pseudomonadota bacterium]
MAEAGRCRICARRLPARAIKCTACGEFQSWWRRLGARLDLSALVALVPIVTLAYAFLADRLSHHGSDLRATVLQCAPDRIRLFATNQGDRGAVMRGASYTISTDSTAVVRPLAFGIDDDERLFEGGANGALMLQPEAQNGITPPLVPHDLTGNGCTLLITVDTVAFDHTATPLEVACPC